MKKNKRSNRENSNLAGIIWTMLTRGWAVLFVGWLAMKLIIFRVGQLNDILVFSATFAPLWLGGAVGWAAAEGAGDIKINLYWLPPVTAALIISPIVFTDPWRIISLGLNEVGMSIKVTLLLLPIITAAAFALFGLFSARWLRRRFLLSRWFIVVLEVLISIIILLLVNLGLYFFIYWHILPRGNFLRIG